MPRPTLGLRESTGSTNRRRVEAAVPEGPNCTDRSLARLAAAAKEASALAEMNPGVFSFEAVQFGAAASVAAAPLDGLSRAGPCILVGRFAESKGLS